jgi:hypothetical protein
MQISALDILEALLLVSGQPRLEQYGIRTKLGVQQRHVPVYLGKELHALVTLQKVGLVLREYQWAAGAPERPPGRDLRTNTI